MVGPLLESIPDPLVWGSVLFGFIGGVCLFDPAIPWNTHNEDVVFAGGEGLFLFDWSIFFL